MAFVYNYIMPSKRVKRNKKSHKFDVNGIQEYNKQTPFMKGVMRHYRKVLTNKQAVTDYIKGDLKCTAVDET